MEKGEVKSVGSRDSGLVFTVFIRVIISIISSRHKDLNSIPRWELTVHFNCLH